MSRGRALDTLGSGPEPEDFAADSPASRLNRVAFDDGPVNSAVQTADFQTEHSRYDQLDGSARLLHAAPRTRLMKRSG